MKRVRGGLGRWIGRRKNDLREGSVRAWVEGPTLLFITICQDEADCDWFLQRTKGGKKRLFMLPSSCRAHQSSVVPSFGELILDLLIGQRSWRDRATGSTMG